MSRSNTIKVLIVEDDPMVRRIITEFLVNIQGFTLMGVASDYVGAQAFIENNDIDLVLLDVYLPDGLGIDLLKWMTQEEYRMDAILITADNRTETLERALRLGAMDFLVKPFRMERFNEALNNYKKSREVLSDKTLVDQSDIDSIIKTASVNMDYKNQTSEMILNYLMHQASDSFTSTEIANALGISRITARKYLENMELSGEVLLELGYGGIGRPKNRYRFSDRRSHK